MGATASACRSSRRAWARSPARRGAVDDRGQTIVHEQNALGRRTVSRPRPDSDAARPQFDAAIASAFRLRNSVIAEVLLIALVYVGVGFVWRTQVALGCRAGGVPADWTIAAFQEPAGGWAWSACRSISSLHLALVFPDLRLGALPVAGVARIDLPVAAGTSGPLGRRRILAR